MNKKKKINEILQFQEKELIVLSCFGHVAIDYVSNLFDNNKQIIKIPSLYFFRKLMILKRRKKIFIDQYKNKKTLSMFIRKNFLKKSPMKSYNFFKNSAQKRKFDKYFIDFLNTTKEKKFEKKIFLAINYSIAKIHHINILSKKYIFTQEDRPNYCHFYSKFFNVKYLFVVRDPRATFSGSFKSQKLHKIGKTYGFDRVLGNYLTAAEFIEKFSNKKLYLLKNESFQGKKNLRKQMKKICKWLNISFSKSLLQPTYFGKIWHGDSAYLGKREQKKPLPKNYYELKNIRKRWKSNLTSNQILDIEMLLFRLMKRYGYVLENKVSLKNLIKAYYRALFLYKDDYSFLKNIYYTFKNVIRRSMILTNALYASKFVDLD